VVRYFEAGSDWHTFLNKCFRLLQYLSMFLLPVWMNDCDIQTSRFRAPCQHAVTCFSLLIVSSFCILSFKVTATSDITHLLCTVSILLSFLYITHVTLPEHGLLLYTVFCCLRKMSLMNSVFKHLLITPFSMLYRPVCNHLYISSCNWILNLSKG
jgi:hypothetical protein